MVDEIYFDGVAFFSASEAAGSAGLTRDYIARLCKDGKLIGKRIGKQWYVSRESLHSFALEQEYSRERRREELAKSRRNEYREKAQHLESENKTLAHRTRIADVRPARIPEYVHGTLSAIARAPLAAQSVRAMASAPVHAISIGKQATAHALPPITDVLHKLVAVITALLFTVGTYLFVDAQYARIAERSSTFATALEFGSRQFALASENPAEAFGGIFERIARGINRSVDSLVYQVMYPAQLTGVSPSRELVEVRVVPRRAAPVAASLAQGTTNRESPSTARTVITQPVIERVVETQRIVAAAGGLTEEILSARLNQLDNKLTSQILSIRAQAPVTATTIVQQATAGATRIDDLGSITLRDSTITGGSISGTSVSATSLTVTGTGTSTFSGGIQATALNITTSGTSTFSGGLQTGGFSASGQSSLATTTISTLTVTGDTTLQGTLSIPGALTITSSTISLLTNTYATTSFISAVTASTTNLTWVTATGTNTILTNATSSILYVSNLASFGTASTTNLTLNGFSQDRIPYIGASGAVTSSSVLTFDGTLLKTTNASTSIFSSFGPAYFGGSATSTFTNAGRLGILTASPNYPLEVTGAARFSSTVDAANVIATSTSATSTFAGGFLATRIPSTAHTFSSWAIGAANSALFDAALVVNPASAGGDTNLISAGVNGSVKFLVDAEGDVFVNNLTSVGSVTLSTTSASTFTVENNTTLGDSSTDVTTITGTLTVSGTTTAASVAGKFGVGTTSPWAKLSIHANNGETNTSLFTIASSTATATTTLFDISNTGAITSSGTFTSTASGASTIPYASSTALSVSGTGYFGTASSTNLTVSGIRGGLLATDMSGVVSATTTIGTNLLSANTISGIALGSNLAGLSPSDTTLTFSGSQYIGSAAITVGLNLGNANAWTALQKFTAGASTTQLSVFDKTYFGGTATSSFSSAGALTLAGVGSSLLSVDSSGAVVATTTPTARFFTATSTSQASTFPYASSTAFTVNNTTGATTTALYIANLQSGTTTSARISFLENDISSATTTAAISSILQQNYNGGKGDLVFSTLNAGALMEAMRISNTGSTTIVGLLNVGGSATSTIGAGLSSPYLNITGTAATSTFARGIDLAGGCFSVNGTCLVSNSQLLASANTWTGLQTFQQGLISQASSTFTAFTQLAQASTTMFTSTGNTYLTALTSAVLGVDNTGKVVATTSIGTNLLSGSITNAQLANSSVTINSAGLLAGGGSLSLGGSLTLNASTSPTVGYVFATSTVASTLPYASSTAFTVSGTGFFATASTTNLTVSGLTSGSVLFAGASGAISQNNTTLNWDNSTSFLTVGSGITSPHLRIGSAPGYSSLGATLQLNSAGATQSAVEFFNSTSGAESSDGSGIYMGDLNLTLNNRETGYMRFMTSNQERVRILGTGGVGIGTTTPFWNLTVASSTGPQLALTDTTSGSNAWTFRNIANAFYLATSSPTATSSVAALAFNALSGAATFGSPATTSFTGGAQSTYLNITGTAATSTFARGIDLAAGCFSVNGTCLLSNAQLLSTANTWTALQKFTAGASTTQLSVFNKAYFGGTATTTIDSTGIITAAGVIRAAVGSSDVPGLSFENPSDANSRKTGLYLPATGILGFSTAGNEVMRIDASGNVGIGTTSPQTKLEVVNTSSGATADQLYLSNLASATSTASRLSFRTQDIINNTGTTTSALTSILKQNFNTGKGDLAFSTLQSGTLTEAMRLTAAGDLGIGTSTPYHKLTIWGSDTSANTTSFLISDSASTTIFKLTNNGQATFNFASTTAANVSGTLFSGTASTTNLTVSGAPSGILQTSAIGVVSALTTSASIASNLSDETGSNNGALVFSAGPTFTGTTLFASLRTTGNASTTLFSAYGPAYFGGSATSSFALDGSLNVATAFTAYASSTIGSGTQAGGLTISGGATTTGNLIVQGGSTSTFSNGISATYLNITGTSATSTFARGINLAGGCFSINGTCVGGGGGSGTINSGTTGQFPYYASSGTTLSATSSIYLATSGNVGIGTTSPSAKLEISASSTASMTGDLLYLTNLSSATSTASRLTFRTDDIVHNTGTSTAALTSIIQQNFNTGKGDLAFSTLQSGTLTEVMRITSLGYLGVGTTTPYRKLSVTDTVSNAQFALAYDGTRVSQFQTDASGDLVIDPSGNDVLLSDDNLLVCTTSCGTSPSGTGSVLVENKLGVGTTTPGAKLTIETSDSTTNFFQIASTTAQSLLVMTANGNLGLATSSPFAKFTVGAGGAITTVENALTDSATIAVSWLDGNQQRVTLGGNRTINFSNYVAGQILRLVVCQDSTGSRTVTWDSAVLWNGDSAPTLTTTANQCDLATFIATNATGTLKIFGAAALAF